MNNRKQKRIIRIFCGVFVAALLVSGALIATHLQHECPGRGCSVCTAISAWEQLLRGLALAAATGGALRLTWRAGSVAASAHRECDATHTLVTLKVKLSD